MITIPRVRLATTIVVGGDHPYGTNGDVITRMVARAEDRGRLRVGIAGMLGQVWRWRTPKTSCVN